MENDAVVQRLKSFGLDEATIEKIKSELGVEAETDLDCLTEQDLIDLGVKKIQARKVVMALRPATVVSEPVATSPVATVSFESVLPIVPTDASWLEALRTGGVLKVDQSSVISAIRAALAYKAGLFDIPDSLVRLMESFADSNDEQVDPVFFKLRKQITRRSYGEIFEAIDGLDGNYVTDTRKKQLFARVDQYLWPSITQFYDQLKSWYDTWLQGSNNPSMWMGRFAGAMGGNGHIPMMPAIQPPDTGILRDHADAVNDALNRVFAGTGVQIAAALAYEASRIKETLEDPRLPALTGAANRDQMIKMLKVAVSATYPRLELNLTRFVLSVMRIKDQSAGNEELQYFEALYMLGSQISWGQMAGDSSIEVRRPVRNASSGLGRTTNSTL